MQYSGHETRRTAFRTWYIQSFRLVKIHLYNILPYCTETNISFVESFVRQGPCVCFGIMEASSQGQTYYSQLVMYKPQIISSHTSHTKPGLYVPICKFLTTVLLVSCPDSIFHENLIPDTVCIQYMHDPPSPSLSSHTCISSLSGWS